MRCNTILPKENPSDDGEHMLVFMVCDHLHSAAIYKTTLQHQDRLCYYQSAVILPLNRIKLAITHNFLCNIPAINCDKFAKIANLLKVYIHRLSHLRKVLIYTAYVQPEHSRNINSEITPQIVV